MNARTMGMARALRGLRTGDQRALMMGAALVAFDWLRRNRQPRALVKRIELRSGQSVVIRSTLPGRARLQVRDPDRQTR
ncbi:MAG: hypothetical protein ACRDVM_05550 [Acidimicrobiia bacterium]